jgi:5-(carboxyamino)imidazole ribonucleotide synthase
MSRVGTTFLPGTVLGILGGGQLGRMIAVEAQRMGYRVAVLDNDPHCPASHHADQVIVGAFSDATAVLALAGLADVVTVETEHIPWELLANVEQLKPMRPAAQVLQTVQDRLTQKRFLAANDIPHVPFLPVADAAQLAAALTELGVPAVLKTRHGGYDGKGQARLHSPADVTPAWASLNAQPAVLEAFVDFRGEISVVLARGIDGATAVYAVAENVHHSGVLHTTLAPARIPAEVAAEAVRLARAVATALDHVGVLAVEMFLLPDGRLLVNEIAPRVHNSGHFTLGACETSQFEQHLRAVCGLPLAETTQYRPAVMLNLLGDLWRDGEPDWRPVLQERHAHLHLYGKRDARPGRKMGHVLVVQDDADAALATAERLHRALSGT